jgi:integrase
MKALVESYLALRRRAGFKLREAGRMLSHFARFCDRRGLRFIRSTQVIAWAAQSRSLLERGRRLRAVYHLALFLRSQDARHQLPVPDLFPYGPVLRPPHIFTPAEIRALLAAAGRLGPRGSIRPHVYRTLFGLLACTGLRVSEALALTFDDVSDDGLLVRLTKFGKSRLVPLHPTARAALEKYLRRRRRLRCAAPHLFVSIAGRTPGRALGPNAASRLFRSLLQELGMRSSTAAPRLHDLRHTFAVRSLEAPTDLPVGRHLVGLSTYLGHAQASSTYWYLRATPPLLSSISTASEAALFAGPLT